ncbi:hypothetical protein GQ54DRAFT_299916 [Martensiomyces pterosporus]|nr:hypothetical protein GQ54DRAFT_299916 [Martensiomyces pterosporus]
MVPSNKKALWRERRRQQQQQHYLGPGVFKMIFDYILNTDVDTDPRTRHASYIDKLYELQPLTAVCRRWRRATLPLFYETAVCSIKQNPHYDSTDHEPGHTCDPKNARMHRCRHIRRTNVGLIIAGGHAGKVRRLVIDLVGDVAPDLPVTMLANEEFGAQDWSGIHSLRLNHWHGYILSKPVYSTESLARLNAYLLHMLPKLTSVKYHSPGDRRYYTEFPLDGLLTTTLSKLDAIKISSGLIPDLGSSAFLPKLASLTLRCPMLEGAANLPRIFAETLVTLHIGFTSAETIWNRFYTTDGTHRVEFKRLESLVLEYYEPRTQRRRLKAGQSAPSLYDECSAASHSDSDNESTAALCADDAINGNRSTLSKQRPVFYRLQHLSIRRYPYAIARVLRHFPIDRIPHISIRDITRGWSDLRATSISDISSLRVHIAHKLEDKSEERKYQVWINRLFSVSSQMTSLQLQAPPTQTPIALPDVIGLTNLTTLSFSMKMDLGSIPNLLSRLPHLRRLVMHVHPMSSWSMRNYGVLERGDYGLLADLPPLSYSLQHLVAYTGLGSENDCRLTGSVRDEDEDEDEEGVVVERELAWLMARIPSLLVFKTEEWTMDAVERCVREMAAHDEITPYIKHLKTMEMSVWKY